MTGMESNSQSATASATEVLAALRDGQASEMATIRRCTGEIQIVSVDRSLASAERQAMIRTLQQLRNQANQALRDLEDAELRIVAESQYAKDAVDALTAAARLLITEVSGTREISQRTTEVAGAIDGVSDAAGFVLSRVG
jgi:hypothetical protein